ncbi:MAG: branched-chain amino acid ABC transporter permease [Desulfobacterales bacterium]|nr:branched-chain amino acid ABC transporter permease [Desulfobacterales bacterium]
MLTQVGPRERRKERLDRGLKVRTEGIYALSSGKEALYLLAPRLTLILGLLILPLLMPNLYWQRVICITGVFGLLSLAFDFLANYVGLICLGGALFMGVGGYITGILNSLFGMPLVATIPAATVVGAVFSTVLLSPCFPLRGIYFAIVTLMYPLAASRIIEALDIFGGTEGMADLDTLPNIWFASYSIIPVLLVSLFALRRLVTEDIGLVLRGLKDNDQAAKASGISITRYKAYSTFIASAIGCFTGAYLVHLYGWAGISLFALDFSILPIAASVIGGMGTLVGPVLGAFILIPLTELLRELGTLRIVFYSLLLAGFIVFNPEGLMTYAQRKYHQFEHWVEV